MSVGALNQDAPFDARFARAPAQARGAEPIRPVKLGPLTLNLVKTHLNGLDYATLSRSLVWGTSTSTLSKIRRLSNYMTSYFGCTIITKLLLPNGIL